MPWKRVAKIDGWTLGAVVLLIGGAATAGYFFLTSSDFRSRVESEASAYSGRKTKIDRIRIDWGATAHVHLEGFEVANADWAKNPQMLKADEVDFDLRLWPLLKGNIVLQTLVLRRPEGDRSRWGRTNSSIGARGSASGHRHREGGGAQEPLADTADRRLEITEGKIQYQDSKRKLALDGSISTASGKAGAQPQAELTLKGKLENQPLQVHFVGGSQSCCAIPASPTPSTSRSPMAAHRLTAKGTLDDPFEWKGANVDLTLSGPNLSEIYPLLGNPGPPTPPYRISGKLDHEPARGNSSAPSGMSAIPT